MSEVVGVSVALVVSDVVAASGGSYGEEISGGVRETVVLELVVESEVFMVLLMY